jgi:type VI secretion system protein ImpL
LQDELAARQRGLILDFPSQLSGVRSAVVRLLEGAFPRDAREGPALLRGFYFTSGVQQGAPLDRLLGAAASVYEAPAPAAGSGRAYFLNRLLMDVVFGEAGLVQGTAGARARRGALLTGGLVAVASITAFVLVVWAASFVADLSFQHDVQKKAEAIAGQLQPFDLTEVSERDQGIEEALPALNALRALPGGYDERHRGHAPLEALVGLYDGGLSDKAEQTYLNVLQRIMLPRILLRLERAQLNLQGTGTDAQTAGQLFEPLEIYLVLGGQAPKPLPTYRDLVARWVEADWQANELAHAEPAERVALAQHLQAMLADKKLGALWQGGGGAPLNRTIYEASQTALADIPPANRAYAMLEARSAGPDWQLASNIDPTAFADGPDLVALRIPYFFTKDGYAKAFSPGVMTVEADMKDDAWVLGGKQRDESLIDVPQQLQPLYAADYEAQWDRLLAAVQPGDYFSMESPARAALLADNSPLAVVLKAVQGQTQLQPPGAPPPAPGQAESAAQGVTDHFAALANWISGGQLDALLKAIRTAASADIATSTTSTIDEAASPTTEGKLALIDASLSPPPQLQAFVAGIQNKGTAAESGATASANQAYYAANVKDDCAHTAVGFPFDADSTADADLTAVSTLFGPGGQFDKLIGAMAPKLDDPKAPVWRWSAQSALGLAPDSAGRLQEAQELGTLLRPTGVDLTVQAVQFGPSVTSATLQIGGVTRVLQAGGAAQTFTWLDNSADPSAEVDFSGAPISGGQGHWALFRLFHQGRMLNASAANGVTTVTMRFGGGAQYVTFKITLPPGVSNPFVGAPNGPWAFRCPASL